MRQRQDPVDRAFARWVELTPEQRQTFELQKRGYLYGQRVAHPPAPRKRERLKKSQEATAL